MMILMSDRTHTLVKISEWPFGISSKEAYYLRSYLLSVGESLFDLSLPIMHLFLRSSGTVIFILRDNHDMTLLNHLKRNGDELDLKSKG